MAPSSYEPATKITLQYKLLLICFRVVRGFPKNPLKSPKILSCPHPRCILEAFTMSSNVGWVAEILTRVSKIRDSFV